MKRSVWGRVATVVGVIAIAGGAYYYLSVNLGGPVSERWSAISWRVQVYLMKAYGGIPELSWAELLKTTTQPRGFYLQNVVVYGESVEAALLIHIPPKRIAKPALRYSVRCADMSRS